MSSVISPSHYAIPSCEDGTCKRQSLSRDCCFPTFSKAFTCKNVIIPALKVLAQNIVNAYGIEEVNYSEFTFKQPGKCSSGITTGGSHLTNKFGSFSVTLCGNRNFKDEIDPSEKPHKAKSAYVYRIMQKDMKVEKNRLETFKDIWPLTYIDPSDLAAVGFFYLQCGDKVQCAFCRGIIVDWSPGDDPLTEHALHFPLCPFLLLRDVGNVPIPKKTSFLDSRNNSYPGNSEFSRQTDRASSASNEEKFFPSHPKFSDMKSSDKRLGTFRTWHCPAVSPSNLVEAGFFYTGTEDIVACFYCGGTLGHWNCGDDPWVEHKKHFPHCAYLKSADSSTAKSAGSVLQESVSKSVVASQSLDVTKLMRDVTKLMKSELYVEASKIFSENLVLEALERNICKKQQGFSSLEDLCSTILEIQDETQKKANAGVECQGQAKSAANSSVDRHMCKICCDKEMGIVFLPCGHMVACPECARSVVKCPVCRRTIESAIRAYMS